MIDREAIKRIVHDTMVSYAGQEGGTPRIDWYLLRNELVEALTSAGEGAVPVGWQDEFAEAYLAFTGAFDTPAARRRQDDEFATDARRRMRALAERIAAAAPHPPRQDGAREGELPKRVSDAIDAYYSAAEDSVAVGMSSDASRETFLAACDRLRSARSELEAAIAATTPPAPDEAEFWCRLLGEAIDALDECAGDDEEGWDRQEHARISAEAIRAKYKNRLVSTEPAPDEAEREAIAAWLEKQDGKGWFHGSLSHCLRRLANAIRSRRDVGGGV